MILGNIAESSTCTGRLSEAMLQLFQTILDDLIPSNQVPFFVRAQSARVQC